jgi:hypothetical protein
MPMMVTRRLPLSALFASACLAMAAFGPCARAQAPEGKKTRVGGNGNHKGLAGNDFDVDVSGTP